MWFMGAAKLGMAICIMLAVVMGILMARAIAGSNSKISKIKKKFYSPFKELDKTKKEKMEERN